MTVMYDQACHDLAVVFIDDDPDFGSKSEEVRKDLYHRLAGDIQSTIEDFIEYEKTTIQEAPQDEDGEDG